MKIYTITGCSASGKDKILNTLIKNCMGLTPIISTTSRPMRTNEIQGREYNFISNEVVENMLINNDFIESRSYKVANGDTWIYGITKDSIKITSYHNYIVIVDFQGLQELKKYLCDREYESSLTSIYIDCSYQTRLLRSLQREGKMTDEQVAEVIRRFTDDNENVAPAKEYCDYVVNNEGDFSNTINRILDILED